MSLPENPITRGEKYLAKIARQSVDIPETPITREEQYLDYIARNGGGGGGDIQIDDTLTQPGQAADAKAAGDAIRAIDTSTDSTLSVEGKAADAKAVGDALSLIAPYDDTEIRNMIGDLDDLTTTDKTDLVSAINEVEDKATKRRSYTLYAFHIDGSESDPSAAVTYLHDAVGMTPAAMDYTNGAFSYGSWGDAFFIPRPVMLRSDGTVDYYLDPDDYSKKSTGTTSDVANTSYNGNAMMEWGRDGKKIWYKVTPDVGDVTSGTVYICDEQIDPSFKAWPFINNHGVLVDHFYTPIYNGSLISDKLRSLSGQAVAKSITNGASGEIAAATANNTGDDVLWYIEVMADRILINFLLILMGKSLDTQTVFGRGLDTGSETALTNYTTGALNDKGLFFGYNDGNHGVKVFGMENYWAAQWRRTAGYIVVDGDQRIKLTYGTQDGSGASAYNTDGTNYISMGITPTGTPGGYVDKVNINQYGMFSKDAGATGAGSSTYFCDGMWFNNSGVGFALFGGRSDDGVKCGAFYCLLSAGAGLVHWGIGAALSCKPLSS